MISGKTRQKMVFKLSKSQWDSLKKRPYFSSIFIFFDTSFWSWSSVSYNLTIDNSDHSGLAPITLTQTTTGSDDRSMMVSSNLIMDLLALLVCLSSITLVVRSLYRAQKLRRAFTSWSQRRGLRWCWSWWWTLLANW